MRVFGAALLEPSERILPPHGQKFLGNSGVLDLGIILVVRGLVIGDESCLSGVYM